MKINGYSFNVEHAKKFKTLDEFTEAYKGSAYTHYRTGDAINADTQAKLLRDAFNTINPPVEEQQPKKGKKQQDGDGSGNAETV